MIWLLREGPDILSLWDWSTPGACAHDHNVHPERQSTHLVLPDTWRQQQWRLFINGAPDCCSSQHPQCTLPAAAQPWGDATEQPARTVPISAPLWELGAPLERDALFLAIRQRRRQMGSFRMQEGSARVYGPHHGDIVLRLGTGDVPDVRLVQQALRGLLGTPIFNFQDGMFVRYRHRDVGTIVSPAPYPGMVLMPWGCTVPIPRFFVGAAPSTAVPKRPPAPAEDPASSPGTGGTSLAQRHTRAPQPASAGTERIRADSLRQTIISLQQCLPMPEDVRSPSPKTTSNFQFPDGLPGHAFDRFDLREASLQLPDDIQLHPSGC